MTTRPFHTTRTTLIALATGLALASSAAMAQDAPPPPPVHGMAPQPGGPNGPNGHGGPGPRALGGPLFAGVDLSDAQRAQIDTIVHREAPAMHDRMKAAFKAREDLEALSWSGHFDEAQARRIAQSGAQVMVDVAVDHARTESEIVAVLTPAQRAQVQANRAKIPAFGPHGGPDHRDPDDHGPQHGDAPPPAN